MRLLISSDSHLDLVSEGLERNRDIDKVMSKIILDAKKSQIDYFMFLGDWCHNSKPSVEANKILLQWLLRLENSKINTRWIAGNHDVSSNGENSLIPFKEIGFKHIKFIDEFYCESVDDKNLFIYLPYMATSILKSKGFNNTLQEYFVDQYSNISNEWDEFDNASIYAFSHLDICGALPGSESQMIKGKKQSIPDEFIEDRKIKAIFNGHLHQNQVYKSKIYCPGSIQCNNFGERDDVKGYYILEL